MPAEFTGIRKIRNTPTIQIVLVHALFGETLEPIGIAGGKSADPWAERGLLARALLS